MLGGARFLPSSEVTEGEMELGSHTIALLYGGLVENEGICYILLLMEEILHLNAQT